MSWRPGGRESECGSMARQDGKDARRPDWIWFMSWRPGVRESGSGSIERQDAKDARRPDWILVHVLAAWRSRIRMRLNGTPGRQRRQEAGLDLVHVLASWRSRIRIRINRTPGRQRRQEAGLDFGSCPGGLAVENPNAAQWHARTAKTPGGRIGFGSCPGVLAFENPDPDQ